MAIRTQITIDIDGLDDATFAPIRRAISGVLAAARASVAEGWSVETALELIRRLESCDRPGQAAVLRRQVEKNGVATREEVYTLGNYEPGRQLKGFTRAVNSIVREFKDEGLVSADSSNPMTPLWDFEGETSKSALAFGVLCSAVMRIFGSSSAAEGNPTSSASSTSHIRLGEVKLRSQHNWQRGPERWQLDVYSDFAPQARLLLLLLLLLLPDERVEAFTSKLETELVGRRLGWTILTLSMLRAALERATGHVAADNNAAARCMLALGRLS